MPRYSGHAPDHVRNMFLSAIEAFVSWGDSTPEPIVEIEINYQPREISISQACGVVWNCSDILPGIYFRDLQDAGLEIGRQTYAAAARAMLSRIEQERAAH